MLPISARDLSWDKETQADEEVMYVAAAGMQEHIDNAAKPTTTRCCWAWIAFTR